MSVRGQQLSTGTAFVVQHAGRPYLVTNRHNLSGRRSDNNELLSQTGATPDSVTIVHNHESGLGNWQGQTEPLLDANGRPLWQEHPVQGRVVDVVALPLTQLHEVQLYPHDVLPPAQQIDVQVTTELYVVGFPYGIMHGGAMGIWTRGTVASEYEIDFDDLPCFLIDSRTRAGQSGSPVIFHSTGGMVTFQGGNSQIGGGVVTQVLGIYSGRVNAESDLGFVWRSRAILEVVCSGVRPTDN